MLKHTLIISLALVLAACMVPGPQDEYDRQVKNGSGPIAQSYSQALSLAVPDPLPASRGLFPTRWKITASNPRMVQGDHYSNYRIFSFQLYKGQPYSIYVGSICNSGCIGFSKFVLKPYVQVIDAQGQPLSAPLVSEDPTSIEWSGTAQTEGTAYLLVAADNKLLSQPIYGYGVTMMTAPFGTVVVWGGTDR